MGQINLYKIDRNKSEEFIEKLIQELDDRLSDKIKDNMDSML